MMIRVKICCISTMHEARTAIELGASAVGLVGHMPTGPGVIDDETIRSISQNVPPPIATFLLTSETDAHSIIRHHQRVHTNTLQLVDRLQQGAYSDIREALPAIRIVQVIHVVNESAVDDAARVAPDVDALLLDSGNPARRELGGTGRTHNWEVSRQIVETVPIPVFLAGGLNSENVRHAIDAVQPFGVDVCSGVRTAGQLDPNKLKNFMTEVNR